MEDFFSNEIGQSIEWFGLTHILLMVGFFITIALLWILSPKIRNSKYEKYVRYSILGLAILFEWRVFESRMLNNSLFRMPLCAISLYLLAFSTTFKKEKVFKIAYFYSFGTLLTFLFFDTLWGLDRWDGWTFFGAHATIAWFAVYGLRVLNFKPNLKDLYHSMIVLAIYTFISGYATYRFGGSDDLFLFSPPVDFLQFLIDINPALYIFVFSILAGLLMSLMYLPVFLLSKFGKN